MIANPLDRRCLNVSLIVAGRRLSFTRFGLVLLNAVWTGNPTAAAWSCILAAGRHIGTNPAKQSQMSGIKGVKTIGD